MTQKIYAFFFGSSRSLRLKNVVDVHAEPNATVHGIHFFRSKIEMRLWDINGSLWLRPLLLLAFHMQWFMINICFSGDICLSNAYFSLLQHFSFHTKFQTTALHTNFSEFTLFMRTMGVFFRSLPLWNRNARHSLINSMQKSERKQTRGKCA